MSDDSLPQQTIAHMIHNTRLATWVMRTIGRAIALFAVPAVLGGIAAVSSGDPGWYWTGAVFSVVFGVVYLIGVRGPLPPEWLVELATDDGGEAAGPVHPA